MEPSLEFFSVLKQKVQEIIDSDRRENREAIAKEIYVLLNGYITAFTDRLQALQKVMLEYPAAPVPTPSDN